MEEKDHLKEILKKIDEVNAPIDLEVFILDAIQKEENLKAQITNYRTKGLKALITSGILVVVLGILFSPPNSVRSVEHSIVTYSSIIITLIILFILLEMGKTAIFNNMKNNIS